jgi:hypothetical protein
MVPKTPIPIKPKTKEGSGTEAARAEKLLIVVVEAPNTLSTVLARKPREKYSLLI